ncbi:UDP-glycosyltransferase 71A16-like [Prunus yedoensis var. nudiflora]|uniref:Glycosyltransferase n=1 Tax=Prunus yedoensis var. nudiflora TaxID=2094558 RepID=A0A314ZD99_PRUYE|nr:UDP-glycosyltransferase 71A16-like [Prunus yedoensis var. nudiflora]
MKRPAELVFIPAAGIGHVVSTIEIAKLLVSRDDHLFITLLIMKRPFDKLFTNMDSSISPRINFVNLPETTDLFDENQKTQSKMPSLNSLSQINLTPQSPGSPGLWLTCSCCVSRALVPPPDASGRACKDVTEYMHSDSELDVPSFVNPLPASVLPGGLLEKESAESSLNNARRFRETKGILVNTFWELESHALHSISHGKNPPVYHVGPLLNLKSSDDDKGWDILSWLDDHQPLSVVFLCFGSMGSFGEAQLKEIACALEHTGLRFLWSLRQPPLKGKMAMPSDYADLSGVLPEGFLDRTAKIGKVIGWAPQVDILAHSSIGGFVSHCGWNSTLESMWYGVPVATWPMYAEQQTNAFQLIKELGLAVEIKMDYRKDSEMVVSAQDIERGIRQVMEHDSVIRKRVKEMSEKGKKSLMNGGSSYSSLGHFIDQI